MPLLDFFKRASKTSDGGDTGKPNILIMLPVYLMQGRKEPFAELATDYNDPKLDIISVYVTLYKVFCYNKSLLKKFGNDLYYSTILDKQRERVARFSLEFSETFFLLIRMFHQLDELRRDVPHPELDTLEYRIGFALIRKEAEFSDIRDNEDEGSKWLAQIQPVLKAARTCAEEYFEGRWEHAGFSQNELEAWLTKRPEGEVETRREEARPISLDQLLAELQAQRGKVWPLGEMIEYRHKLTANIRVNLYGGGIKEEGRRALAARNSLDETIFGATADMIEGDVRGLEHLKIGIAMENIAEKMEILEELSATSKQRGMNMKRAMIDILTDADRLNRFAPDHQAIMKSAASGFGFFAEGKFKKVLKAIQQQAQAVQFAGSQI